MLFKYRDFSNLQFALDIFVNRRLFAAPFESLNDPMEGAYLYSPGTLTPEEIRAIYGQKNEWHILSLSETFSNMLMWSYYASGHSGMVVGVTVVERSDVETRKVIYDENLSVAGYASDIAKEILTRKRTAWLHEREHRVFKRRVSSKDKGSFVEVDVKRIVFGIRTDKALKGIVSDIARRFCPGIEIETIKEKHLEKGLKNL